MNELVTATALAKRCAAAPVRPADILITVESAALSMAVQLLSDKSETSAPLAVDIDGTSCTLLIEASVVAKVTGWGCQPQFELFGRVAAIASSKFGYRTLDQLTEFVQIQLDDLSAEQPTGVMSFIAHDNRHRVGQEPPSLCWQEVCFEA